MTSFTLSLPGRSREVSVHVGLGILKASPWPPRPWPAVLLVADAEVMRRHGASIGALVEACAPRRLEPLILEGGEEAKDVDALPGLWRALEERGVDRSCLLLAAGGGSVLDVAGFLAATWQRGIALALAPTTLLAAVDACLGGKTGVNLDRLKNQVGAFHQPEAVLVDPAVLSTLDAFQWRSGAGEVLKTALLAGEDLLREIEDAPGLRPDEGERLERIIGGCLRAKAAVVAEDERESGRRAVLNLGHTVGHVLETLARDSGVDLPHGLAVAQGLRAETAAFSGDRDLLRRIDGLLAGLDLNRRPTIRTGEGILDRALQADKKRRGAAFTIPVLRAPGEVALETIDAEQVRDAVRLALSGPNAPPHH